VTAMTTGPEPATSTVLRARPRSEGANIQTWVGFKHLMYLVEEGVLEWFRVRRLGPQRLFHEFGLGLEVVDCSVQLPALLEIDDEVLVGVTLREPGRFRVAMHITGPDRPRLALRGQVVVALVPEATAPDRVSPAAEIAAMLGHDIPASLLEDELEAGSAAARPFSWDWRARYFHCHYSDRVQHSAYVRALEEVVERFLDDRGMSIRTLLDDRGYIPVVSRARVRLVGAAHMEETIHTTFAVDEILKGTAFGATMECHVQRAGRPIPVARATILHGYASSRGADAGALIALSDAMQARLLGLGAAVNGAPG
jgi:acyl-CoA thioesterase FadM